MVDPITIVDADLGNPAHGAALVELLDAYMRDPMEGGEPPPERIKRELVPGLRAHPACYVFFAQQRSDHEQERSDHENDDATPVGFAICFLGFSTFRARPIINVHDIFVVPELRGRGVGRRLLDSIEAKARAMNCCRLTLEVREDNHVARGLYRKFGFGRAEFGPTRVPQEFWMKTLE